jgi:hypothetical protein
MAWVEFNCEHIEIKKLERAIPPVRGGPTRLVEALKTIARKHGLPITGAAIAYLPDPPAPPGPVLSQKELEGWYDSLGFKLVRERNGTVFFWYPAPPSDSV